MARSKPKTVERPAQHAYKGLVIRSRDFKQEEVVRSVSIVLHLANGSDEVYEQDEMMQVLDPQPGPPDSESEPTS